jgi:hypothetical protein
MQPHLARGHFFSMALDAMLGKDRLDLLREINLVLRLARDSDQQHSSRRNNASSHHGSEPCTVGHRV